MARSNILTAVQVRNAGPGMYNDGNGLQLVVSPNGAKSWLLRVRWQGKRPEIGLGSLAETSLADAREKASDIRKAMRKGIDPRLALKHEGSTSGSSPTFSRCWPQFVDDKSAEWRNAKHIAQWSSTLKKYADPIIGEVPVDEITLDHIEQILRPIWTTKTETASRVRGRIERVLSWAIVKGYRKPPNPAIWRGNLDMLFPAPNKLKRNRHHPAMPYADVPDFMAELRKRDSVTAMALEITVLTACRTSEVTRATWDEIDGDVWTIPAERMKANRPHRVPLTPRVLEILESLPGTDSADHLFPGLREGRPLSNMAMLQFLKRDMGQRDLTVHGFRSSFKDWAMEVSGFPGELSEAQLAHVIANKAQAAYERGDKLQRRRELMEAWEAYCHGA